MVSELFRWKSRKTSQPVTVAGLLRSSLPYLHLAFLLLYANDGHELVHLINHCLISNDGKIIARYDQSINLFYDEFDRPIDVTIDGTNFQHVNLINRKGLDIINGEVFDAETHNRISSITVVHKAKDFDAL